MQDKTKHDKTRQESRKTTTRQDNDKTRQDKTRQDKIRQGKARQDKKRKDEDEDEDEVNDKEKDKDWDKDKDKDKEKRSQDIHQRQDGAKRPGAGKRGEKWGRLPSLCNRNTDDCMVLKGKRSGYVVSTRCVTSQRCCRSSWPSLCGRGGGGETAGEGIIYKDKP
jgi:hypothetical protein